MPDLLNFNINEIINYDFHENNILKKHILNSLIDLNIESIDIDDTKIKGGFISDVIAIKLYLKDSSILNCICKLENQNDNILSKMSKDLDLYNREYFFYKYIDANKYSRLL